VHLVCRQEERARALSRGNVESSPIGAEIIDIAILPVIVWGKGLAQNHPGVL
jgi:hypothetical protein